MDMGLITNAGLVGGIIAILQVIKSLDTQGKLAKGFYILAAMGLGFLCGFIVVPYEAPLIQWIQSAVSAGVTYAGASSIMYQTGKLVMSNESEKIIHK